MLPKTSGRSSIKRISCQYTSSSGNTCVRFPFVPFPGDGVMVPLESCTFGVCDGNSSRRRSPETNRVMTSTTAIGDNNIVFQWSNTKVLVKFSQIACCRLFVPVRLAENPKSIMEWEAERVIGWFDGAMVRAYIGDIVPLWEGCGVSDVALVRSYVGDVVILCVSDGSREGCGDADGKSVGRSVWLGFGEVLRVTFSPSASCTCTVDTAIPKPNAFEDWKDCKRDSVSW